MRLLMDHLTRRSGFGSVFQINGQVTTRIAPRVRVGTPTGVAFTLDASVSFESALQQRRDCA
jgi:hypothetical protein